MWKLIRSLLFRLDAELAHGVMVRLIRALAFFGPRPLRIVCGTQRQQVHPREILVCGLPFASRVGLAAGFDKNAELIGALPWMGFGFAEIGTVTPKPQPGNERPRLFRDPQNRAIFNRMGFNGLGAALVSQYLAQVRPRLPQHFRVGVNLGKNKETSASDAGRDYARAAEPFAELADYLVINVSSPNTPGLRQLQEVESLLPIVEAVNRVTAQWRKRPPIFLKLAPELKGAALVELIQAIEGRGGVDGWVLTNTLAGQRANDSKAGGWSGGPLTKESRERLREARAQTRLPVISVGGILSVEEAIERRRLGADLIQVYTGWIYEGPKFPAKIANSLN